MAMDPTTAGAGGAWFDAGPAQLADGLNRFADTFPPGPASDRRAMLLAAADRLSTVAARPARDPKPDAAPTVCPNCGADVSGCWHCGIVWDDPTPTPAPGGWSDAATPTLAAELRDGERT